MIRVLLVDDQPLVRAGLLRILGHDADIEVVGECSDGDEVLDAVARTCPDVVVMDVRMKRVDGAEATRRVRAADGGAPPVLVLTTFDDDETVAAALAAGAAGFILKDAPGEDILRAVRLVAAGDAWLDPAITPQVLDAYRAATPATLRRLVDVLTARESDVLRLVGRGRSNQEIAAELFISEATVKTHVGSIFTKLGLRDRAAAIVCAFDAGLVQPGELRP